MLASGSYDGTVGLWDPLTGARLTTLNADHFVLSVSFSSNGRHIACLLRSGRVRVWDIVTKSVIHTFSADVLLYRGLAVSFSPKNPNLLASISGDRRCVQLWDIDTGKLCSVFKPTALQSRLPIEFIALSPDGKVLVTASREIRQWDINTGKSKLVVGKMLEPFLHGDRYFHDVTFSPDGKLLAGALKGHLLIVNLETGAVHKTGPSVGNDCVSFLRFSADAKVLASFQSTVSPSIYFWDTSKMMSPIKDLHKIITEEERVPLGILFSLDRAVVARRELMPILLWDPQKGMPLRRLAAKEILTFPGVVKSPLKLSSDGKLLMAYTYGRCTVWHIATGTICCIVNIWKGDGGDESTPDQIVQIHNPLDGSPQGAFIDTGFTLDGKLWMIHSTWNWRILWLRGPLTLSPNCTLLVSVVAEEEERMKIWDVSPDPKLVCEFIKPDGVYYRDVVFTLDGKLLAAGSSDGQITLWDTSTWASVHTIDIGVDLSVMSFRHDTLCLATDWGLVRIDPNLPSGWKSQGIFIDRECITFNRRELIWLPPNYMRSPMACYGNILVLDHDYLDISCIELDLDQIPGND